MKILFAASRASHITNFHLPYIDYFKNNGYEVHVITSGEVKEANKLYNIFFEKKIISVNNIKTIFNIKKILEKERYDIIITNTTLVSFLVRMAKQISNVKKYGKLINIVHGYLFSLRTNPLKKELYIIAEKLCKNVTNRLLIMNEEDYIIAEKYSLSTTKPIMINGMGLPRPEKYDESIRKKTREKYKISETDILFTYAGELSKRKNQIFLIENLQEVIEKYPDIKLILAGDGAMKEYLEEKIFQNGLSANIFVPGYIKEIKKLIFASDYIMSSSISEGLPFNILEAMSFKKPVLASDIKGHRDLITNAENGYLFKFEKKDFLYKINMLVSDKNIRERTEKSSKIENYYIDKVFSENVKYLTM